MQLDTAESPQVDSINSTLIPNAAIEDVENALDHYAEREAWASKESITKDGITTVKYVRANSGISLFGFGIAHFKLSHISGSVLLEATGKWSDKNDIEKVLSYAKTMLGSQDGRSFIAQEVNDKVYAKNNSPMVLSIILVAFILGIFSGWHFYLQSSVVRATSDKGYDAIRVCDIAKIQYALETNYDKTLSYPDDIYDTTFQNQYRKLFPGESYVPDDPETGITYSYWRFLPERYKLSTILSNNTTPTKDPELDFPGKNSALKSGDYSNQYSSIDASVYTYPCSTLFN